MTRRRINLNRGWRFFRGDAVGAERVGFDDSSWQPAGLPHTFDLPYFRTPEFYVGYGWYRRRFEVPSEWLNRRVSLEFDGVFQIAELFINEQPVGTHRGGYTGFSIDITDAIRAGNNVLAVRVNNHWDAQLQPRAGEHVFCGGIYRDLHLLVTHPVHFAWHGTTVQTPQASSDSATVVVNTQVVHDRPFVLRHAIVDPTGVTVATGEGNPFITTITGPKLWHPDHPHLYQLRQELLVDDVVVDECETFFGIRWFEWTADRGFFLNGEHLYLRGANVHQDHAGWGIGITRAACERDIRLIKQAGFNFVRGAHYPHHPAFADACDRLGLLFWSENAFWGKGGFGPEGYWNASAYPIEEAHFAPFEQSCKDQLREMIRINCNHPSIIAWSMTNEAFFTYNLDRARALIRDLVRLSRKLDPTRPAAVGGAQRGDVDDLGDVAGYNGDGSQLFINPGVPNMVSEYGAISKPHDVYEPFYGELQTERFPWRSGQAIWCGFDYGSIAGRQGLKGIANHQRVPKRSWYWYRSAQLGISPPDWPVHGEASALRLSADKLFIEGADATDDCQITITVHDQNDRRVRASPQVTLTIESGPGEFPTGRSITFAAESDIGIADGEAAIAFRSYYGGRSVIRATSPGLASTTLEIITRGEPRFVEGLTPPVPDRPYAPPPVPEPAKQAMAKIVNVALNRPCRAGSETEGHPARFANDGSADTAWAADPNATQPWWQVDLEGFYQVSGSRLTFPGEGNWRYTIDLSTDGATWSCAVDQSETTSIKQVRHDIYPPGAVARYVRLTFVTTRTSEQTSEQTSSQPPPALAEVQLFGILSVR
ncbi:MAG TPA: glycoside hydrolase family 2 TIM barrel-domain containing protein [Tepidisphaeraceae bacterium]|nr:glycoside hydrolase family 2 TIM barrel-domain containing protein [Tepidisphaeraceae bacterium]